MAKERGTQEKRDSKHDKKTNKQTVHKDGTQLPHKQKEWGGTDSKQTWMI